ncbi:MULTISPECIES: hypothetical protein [unclassified Enterococcus]|jgi:hypothetical protein
MFIKWLKTFLLDEPARIDPYEVDNEFILKSDFPKTTTKIPKNNEKR